MCCIKLVLVGTVVLLRRKKRIRRPPGRPSLLHRVEQGRQKFFRAVDQYNEGCPPPYDLKLGFKQRRRNVQDEEAEDEDA